MTAVWPLFDLRLRTERLELRLPNDSQLIELAAHIDSIRSADMNPFYVDWTSAKSPERERSFLQYHWGSRSTWSTDSWNLVLAVFVDGFPIGVQSIMANRFAVTRSVSSGSWLAGHAQGQGFGKEMRLAVLALAFEGLGAEEAHTATRPENAASTGVTRALGYEPNGTQRLAYGGTEQVVDHKYLMLRSTWEASHADHGVTIAGLDQCLDMFGV